VLKERLESESTIYDLGELADLRALPLLINRHSNGGAVAYTLQRILERNTGAVDRESLHFIRMRIQGIGFWDDETRTEENWTSPTPDWDIRLGTTTWTESRDADTSELLKIVDHELLTSFVVGDASLQDILSAAGSSEAHRSLTAIERLGRMRAVEAVPTLSGFLDHESESIRQAAVSALGSIGGETAIGALAGCLDDKAKSVRDVAVSALGSLGGETVLSHLFSLLPERLSDETVLRAIARNSDAPALHTCLQRTLARLSEQECFRMVAVLRYWLPAAAVADLQANLARPHVPLLSSAQWKERRSAIRAMGEIGGATAAGALRTCLPIEQDYELVQEIEAALKNAELPATSHRAILAAS
jgi:HEAT repeat protein